MKKIYFVAAAALAFVSTPALASEPCELTGNANAGKADANQFDPASAADFATRFTNKVMDQSYPSIQVPEQCREFYRLQVMELNGWTQTTTWDQVPDSFRIPMSVTYTAPPVATPAQTTAPHVAEAETAAAQAQVVADNARRERDAAAANAARVRNQSNASVTAVNRAAEQLQAAERRLGTANAQLAEMRQLANAARASASAAAGSASDAAKAAGLATTAQTAAGTQATAAAASATEAKASADAAAQSAANAQAGGWKWWEILLIAILAASVIGLIVYFLARKGLAKNTDVAKQTLMVECHDPRLATLASQDDSSNEMIEFITSDGYKFNWAFGRKDGMWYTPDGGEDHNPATDLIGDPVKFLQKAIRKDRIAV